MCVRVCACSRIYVCVSVCVCVVLVNSSCREQIHGQWQMRGACNDNHSAFLTDVQILAIYMYVYMYVYICKQEKKWDTIKTKQQQCVFGIVNNSNTYLLTLVCCLMESLCHWIMRGLCSLLAWTFAPVQHKGGFSESSTECFITAWGQLSQLDLH